MKPLECFLHHFALNKTTINLNHILTPSGCNMRMKHHKYWGNVKTSIIYGVLVYFFIFVTSLSM